MSLHNWLITSCIIDEFDNINLKPLSCAHESQLSCLSVELFIFTLDLLVILEMKAAISVSFVLFCLLLPTEGASNDDQNVSPSTKVRFKLSSYHC